MKTVNVVTSYYNDLHKLNWLNLLTNTDYNLILYSKDDNLKKGEFEKRKIETSDFYIDEIAIPNYGRCDYTFFYHIVNNYNNLADYTIFTKINWYDCGHNGLNILLNECINYDFYDAGWRPESMLWYDNKHLEHLEIETKYHKCLKNLDEPYGELSNCLNLENRILPIETRIDWYNYIFPRDKVNIPKEINCYGQGPCFSVSKKLILRHPLSVYEYLLNRFDPKMGCWDPESNQTYNHENLGPVTANQEANRHLHDEFQRFYPVLFTHGIDNMEFKIKEI
jgi:hypothetical protein